MMRYIFGKVFYEGVIYGIMSFSNYFLHKIIAIHTKDKFGSFLGCELLSNFHTYIRLFPNDFDY